MLAFGGQFIPCKRPLGECPFKEPQCNFNNPTPSKIYEEGRHFKNIPSFPLTTTIPLVGWCLTLLLGHRRHSPRLPSPPPSPLFSVPKATTLGTRFDLASPSRGACWLVTPGPQTLDFVVRHPINNPLVYYSAPPLTPHPLHHQLLPWQLGIALLATASSSKGTAHLHTRYMAIDHPLASVSRCLRHATPGSGTPPFHPPRPLRPCPTTRPLMTPSPSVTLKHGFTWHTRHHDQMGPHHKWASHMCKPFLSPSTPPLCPHLTALGIGAMGPSPSGLRVSSCSQQFSPSPPPFFSEVPHPLHLLGLTLLRSTCLLLARSTHWCWCPIKVPIRGPRPAVRLPPAGIAPPYSATLPHPFSCLWLATRWHWSCVLGTECPTELR